MVQQLQLGTSVHDDHSGMQRLNRLPVIIAIIIVVLFIGIVVTGLSLRGFRFSEGEERENGADTLATDFADQLKKGITDGIIGDPEQAQMFQPVPAIDRKIDKQPERSVEPKQIHEVRRNRLEPEAEWLARLKREHDEQYHREQQRQRMARLQAIAVALDSPLNIDISEVERNKDINNDGQSLPIPSATSSVPDLYAAALNASLADKAADPNMQKSKEAFFNEDIKELGYLPNKVVPQVSPYELKRGSVIPATLITGLNSDLPGRITAQVSHNVYDSATGYRLLIPQGAKLFGRYDSKVSFGQQRVLVVWTDLIFPNGATLQIGAMAGTDAEGYGGLKDKVDRHLWRTFGSAALIALVGTGIDRSMPESSTVTTQETASDAARRNFAESFGRVAEQTISQNLNVQPTIRIRPGYRFNILVEQDIIFPSAYKSG